MGCYELMLIFRPDVETDDQSVTMEELKEAIIKNRGEVIGIKDWKRRRLAYEIDKHKEGHYYLVYFSGHGSIIPEVEHFFRVTDTIIRYMIVGIDKEEYEAGAGETSIVTEEKDVPEAVVGMESTGEQEADKPAEAGGATTESADLEGISAENEIVEPVANSAKEDASTIEDELEK